MMYKELSTGKYLTYMEVRECLPFTIFPDGCDLSDLGYAPVPDLSKPVAAILAPAVDDKPNLHIDKNKLLLELFRLEQITIDDIEKSIKQSMMERSDNTEITEALYEARISLLFDAVLTRYSHLTDLVLVRLLGLKTDKIDNIFSRVGH